MSPEREGRMDDLYDLLVANPDGVTVEDIMEHLDCRHDQANDAIRDLRLLLGEGDTISLPAIPNGERERWTYRLVGTIDEAQPWVQNRVTDGQARIRTIHAASSAWVRASSGRTREGKTARIIETGLRHLMEDLENLDL